MDSSVLLTLREFYERSRLPAAIVSDGCRFENTAFASFFGSSVQKNEFVEKVMKKNSSGYEIIDDSLEMELTDPSLSLTDEEVIMELQILVKKS